MKDGKKAVKKAVEQAGVEKNTAAESTYRKEVINPGDEASKLGRDVCFDSHGNCSALTIVPHNPRDFRGPVSFSWKPWVLKEMAKTTYDDDGKLLSWVMAQSEENDGAGGKPSFFTLANDADCFRNLSAEIITMTADDFARSGRLPCFMSNDMNVKRITSKNIHLFRAIMEGFSENLKAANLVNITGETAVMKFNVASPFDDGTDEQLILNWGASCGGLTHRNLLIDGSGIRPGQYIVGFWEEGYRCNGGTYLINLINKIWKNPTNSPEAIAFARLLATPSHSYARAITKLAGWEPDGRAGTPLANMTGIAHITGGGLWGKLGDILPKGVGASLHLMLPPAKCLLEAQSLSKETDEPLSDWNAYDILHGGCGMMVICASYNDAREVIRVARLNAIVSRVVGMTVSSTDSVISVRSQFADRQGEFISSNLPF